MTIRDATAADLGRLLQLEAVCFPEDPWSRHMLTEELSRPAGIFVVAEEGGVVIGLAIAWYILDELHVLQVGVDPAARRRGLGRALMDTLHERARNADAGWLEVRSDNPGAIALYEGMGYRYVATRTRYYEDGCDALVYRRSR